MGDTLDFAMMAICIVTALGAGIAMPLLFLIFGQLVGDFTSYFSEGTTITEAKFMDAVTKSTIYMVYLGLARFILSYISMVRGS
jgi:ATP-binding cassette subfamily B (MDR/TAP) protein 1